MKGGFYNILAYFSGNTIDRRGDSYRPGGFSEKKKFQRKLCTILTLLSLISGPLSPLGITSAQAASTIPEILNYQARITDASGVPLPTGPLNVTILLYSTDTGATCIYALRGTCGTPLAKTVMVTN